MKGILFFVVALLLCTAIVSSAMEMDIEEDNQGLSSALLMASPADEETLLSVESPISGVKEGPDFIKGVHFIELEENARAEAEAHLEHVQNVLLLVDSENEDLKTVTRQLPLTLVQLKHKGGYEQAKAILETIAKMQQAIVDEGAKDLKNMDDLVRFNCKQNQTLITAKIAALTQRKTDQETILADHRKTIDSNTASIATLATSSKLLLKTNDDLSAQGKDLANTLISTKNQRDTDKSYVSNAMKLICTNSTIVGSDACNNSGLDKGRVAAAGLMGQPLPSFTRVSRMLDQYQQNPVIWKNLNTQMSQEQAASSGSAGNAIVYGPPMNPPTDMTPPMGGDRPQDNMQMPLPPGNTPMLLVQMKDIPAIGNAAYKQLGDDLSALVSSSSDAILVKFNIAVQYLAGMIAADQVDQSAFNTTFYALEDKVLLNLAAITDAWKQQAKFQTSTIELTAGLVNDQGDIMQTMDEIKIQNVLMDLEKLRCSTEEQNLLVRQARRVVQTNNLTQLASVIRLLGDSKLPKCTNDCTALAQGRCNWQGAQGVESFCVCSDLFFGSDCASKKCAGFLLPVGASPDLLIAQQMDTVTSSVLGPAAGAVTSAVKYFQGDHKLACSGRGTCNVTTGACTCTTGYFNGTNGACENTSCPQVNATAPLCGGPSRGVCMPYLGSCACLAGIYGTMCEKTKCGGKSTSRSGELFTPDQIFEVCNAHGVCNADTAIDGKCKCDSGFSGNACEIRSCPGDCSGNGLCVATTGLCVCNAGWGGTDCKNKACPGNCSGHGLCSPVTGKCTCQSGFSGTDCSPVRACNKTEANWTISFDLPGWSFCPDGYLMRGFWKNTPNGIFSLEFAACSQPCEGESAPLALKGCYDKIDWSSTFSSAGLTRCNDNTFMAGMSRSIGQMLDSINAVKCCGIAGATWDACMEVSWNTDSNGWSLVNEGSWLSGLKRTGNKADGDNNDLRNITAGLSCSFIRFGL